MKNVSSRSGGDKITSHDDGYSCQNIRIDFAENFAQVVNVTFLSYCVANISKDILQ